jgi:hypothetical protein
VFFEYYFVKKGNQSHKFLSWIRTKKFSGNILKEGSDIVGEPTTLEKRFHFHRFPILVFGLSFFGFFSRQKQ